MASSKEDDTAMAVKQLDSLSLGKSGERNEETNLDAVKSETPTKLCSACGEKSDILKKCTACKCAWYCDKDCQKRHHREHKYDCKRIKKVLGKRGDKVDLGTEKDVGPIGKLPPQEECPICMRVLPIHENLHTYFPCCGKTICRGCDYQHYMKDKEKADREETPMLHTCAFCRKPVSYSDEEILAQLRKRVELKDSDAMRNLAVNYGYGRRGLSVDQAKCIELLQHSADLGFPLAQSLLGDYHIQGKMGLEQNEEEALKYWEKAAEGGHLNAMFNLGFMKNGNGDCAAAMRHWQVSASGGYRGSMDNLIESFEVGLLRHGDLAETLQAFYCAKSEMKSKDRDRYIEYLKSTGEYLEEYKF